MSKQIFFEKVKNKDLGIIRPKEKGLNQPSLVIGYEPKITIDPQK